MIQYLLVGDVLMTIVFLWRLNHLPPQIPLFYSRPWGEDQLADTWMLVFPPLLLNLLIVLNNYLYKKFFLGNILVKRIIDYVSIFLVVSFTVIFIRIILLVT
jgi:hypothetical protein